jgi:hypothetical protein
MNQPPVFPVPLPNLQALVKEPVTEMAGAAHAVATWHFYDTATGLFTGAVFSGTHEEMLAQLAHKGAGVGAHKGDIDYLSQKKHLITGDVLDYKPDPPQDGTDLTIYAWWWDANTKRWKRRARLKKIKADKWDELKTARQAEIDAPLVTAHGTFDHDERSRAAIAEQAQYCAATGAGITYTLADNSDVILTAQQMFEVWAASHAREQSARAKARQLRDTVDACANAAEVAEIDWAGVPTD